MMMKPRLCAFVLFFPIVALLYANIDTQDPSPEFVEEIADASNLPLLNPDFALRETAKLRLENGLELLLISDPGVQLSAAAVCVRAGSWNDPVEFPGMAHFCEHMLFMGTEKYPNENAFQATIADQGGITNAMTLPDRTVYMFSSNTEGFLPLLDQFAHFFIDPLFKPSNIAREMHAVDQEFAKSLEHDGWRMMMVLKETGNQEHPHHKFSCGNSETLSKIPRSKLVEWHQKHYSADRIHVVIFSPLPLDALKEQATSSFFSVPKAAPLPSSAFMPLLSSRQQGHITYIQPVQNKRSLLLLWELPPTIAADPTKSAELLAYTLKRGQKNSLYEKLRQEQLIETLHVGIEEIGGEEHRFFEVDLELTEKGLQSPQTAVLRVFQALAQIQAAGIPHYLFQEKNKMAQIKYQYQSRQDPFSYVMKVGRTLPNEPLESYPRNQVLASEYSPEKIGQAARALNPNKCTVLLIAPPNQPLDSREKWMGAEYAIRPIPSDWMKEWTNATPHPQIRLPEPSPFVPSQLALVPASDKEELPLLIAKNDFGAAYYARSPEFQNPETSIRLHLLSPELNSSTRSQVLATLYCNHMMDVLQPTLAAASQASLNAYMEASRSRIHIKIDGLSEKAPMLLQTILPQLSMPTLTIEQFADLRASLDKEYSNAQKELAFRQAKDLAESLLIQNKALAAEQLQTLRTLSYEDFLSFQKNLFEKTYIEAFFAGNLTMKQAESIWLDTLHTLGHAPFLKANHPQIKVAQLPSQPYIISQTTPVRGNAAILLIDQGNFTFSKRAAQELLSIALKEAFFNELRSKQKTGYIAVSDSQEIEERLFQYFMVQSNSHQPTELLHRFELFLEEFLETLPEKISQERFATLQEGAIAAIQGRLCNLKEKTALWDLLAFSYHGDFQFLNKRIAAIRALSYEELTQTAQEFLSRKNKKRVAILFEGKLDEPFSYEPTTRLHLQEIAEYSPRGQK